MLTSLKYLCFSVAPGLLALASANFGLGAEWQNAEPLQKSAQTNIALPSGWRFVRTPAPGRGKDAVGIMQTVDGRKSDPEVAGLWLRCSERTENPLEVLLVVVQPMTPRAKPTVTIDAARMQASVVSPGTAILLPADATILARGPWQRIDELRIRIEYDGRALSAVVPLAGFPEALDRLATTCASQ